MPAWSGNKVNPAELNSGNEYTKDDQVAIEELNAMVNGGLYAQNFAEALADTPDNTNANNVGTASVELVDNIKGGKTYKKFKFNNLKGDKGEKGDKGDKGDTGSPGGSFTLADFLPYIHLDPEKSYIKFKATAGSNRLHIIGRSGLYIDKGDGTTPVLHSSGDYIDVNYDNAGVYMITLTGQVGGRYVDYEGNYVGLFVNGQTGAEKYLEAYIGNNFYLYSSNDITIGVGCFKGCTNLRLVRIIAITGVNNGIQVNVSSFEDSGIVKLQSDVRRFLSTGSSGAGTYCFKNAYHLKYLENIHVGQVSLSSNEFFYNCVNLFDIEISDLGNYSIGSNVFYNVLIRSIEFPKNATSTNRNRITNAINNTGGKLADNALLTY